MQRALVVVSFLFALPTLSSPQSVAEKMGAQNLRLALKACDFSAQAQRYGTKADLDGILEIAFTTILSDASDVESPLSLVEDAEHLVTLLEVLNQESSELALVTELSHQPEHGESLVENWIFSLVIPSLSDHTFWVIIDRQNERAAYIYGFN